MESIEIRRVINAYRDILVAQEGHDFIRVATPKPKGLTWANCLWIAGWCQLNRVTLHGYFTNALHVYPESWYKKVFKKAYPPLSLITSRKIFDKIKDHPRRASLDELTQTRSILKSYPEEIQKLMLEVGQGWISGKTRSQILSQNQEPT